MRTKIDIPGIIYGLWIGACIGLVTWVTLDATVPPPVEKVHFEAPPKRVACQLSCCYHPKRGRR
jgi:hypothetical protein